MGPRLAWRSEVARGGMGEPAATRPGVRGWRARLPEALTSTSRRAVWRRTKIRRALSVTLLAVAAWVLCSALLPRPVEVGDLVVVATHDLGVGTTIGGADVRLERRPVSEHPALAAREVGAVEGQVTSGAVESGEILTPARLRGPGQLAGLPGDTSAVAVPLLDDGLLPTLRPGDRVDVLAPGTGDTVAASAKVLTIPDSDGGVLGQASGAGGRVVLALQQTQARAVAAAMSTQTGVTGFVIALRPG